MYFLRGSLPWQGLKVDKREDRYKKILDKKKSTTAEELCVGFPNEFAEYINYTRNLGFEQDPDYEYLRGLFKLVMKAQNIIPDLEFDWTLKAPKDSKDNKDYNKEKLPAPVNTTNYVNTAGYVNTSNAVVNTIPDKKKNLVTQENENPMTNSNVYMQTNLNNTNNEINKQNKFQVNQTNYKFIDTINNNDRNYTAQANLNTVVNIGNDLKNSKLHTSFNKSL